MLGLSNLGAVHTAIALVAVACGFAMTIRFKGICIDLSLGWTYVVCTALASITALGIFAHGSFGPPHILAILTLIVLGISLSAGRRRDSSRIAQYVETIGYSTTLLFHLIPATIETTTRLPLGSPIFASQEEPPLQRLLGFVFLAYLLLVAFQIRHIWKTPMQMRRTWLA